ncbi:MAG: glycosyltransferase family 4 protein [Lamprobacter sp.]|uniref:glycosyltransferase family 4 protein n=1 Tax=Lamprobacter sp. TaxID=3100796 RepID=UPI002B257EA0|nr:glycosyltransferase family 4 protein [Lamprobacter sp.]MEA3641130.1 glycosyltransferase family 4 protein [Lamprobacter sp.]
MPLAPLRFLIPGDLLAPTGGYRYDRRLIAGLRAQGKQVAVAALDASFPRPSATARADATAKLKAVPDDHQVVIDGLALGVIPEVVGAERERLRLIGLVHHPLADETGLSTAQRAALQASESAALAAMRKLVVTSAATARCLAQMGIAAEQVAVIEPGTDPAPLARRAGRDPLRLLCVGALIPRKGHRYLIEALARVRDRPWRLDLIGSLEADPATAASIQAQIGRLGLGERMVLHGAVDDSMLEAAYQQADLFVLPSLFEGYGMAFSEALAHGLPILGCDAGAVADTVPSSAGLLVAPRSSAALAAGLRLLLSDRRARLRLMAGAERARAQLPDWPSQIQRWADLLAHV